MKVLVKEEKCIGCGSCVSLTDGNIFDFDEEAYGKPLTLAWYKFIRKNKKFSGIEELSHQLDQDKRDIKQYFYKLKKIGEVKMVITIDGLSTNGKSTLAKKISKEI